MSGPTGLDYTVIPVVLRLQGIPRTEWSQLFQDLQAMEAGALKAMSDKS